MSDNPEHRPPEVIEAPPEAPLSVETIPEPPQEVAQDIVSPPEVPEIDPPPQQQEAAEAPEMPEVPEAPEAQQPEEQQPEAPETDRPEAPQELDKQQEVAQVAEAPEPSVPPKPQEVENASNTEKKSLRERGANLFRVAYVAQGLLGGATEKLPELRPEVQQEQLWAAPSIEAQREAEWNEMRDKALEQHKLESDLADAAERQEETRKERGAEEEKRRKEDVERQLEALSRFDPNK